MVAWADLEPSSYERCELAAAGKALRRKPEMQHIAVGDLILLAFQPQLADVARAGLAAALDVILIRDRLGADEAALEIAVDAPSRLRAL